MKISIDYDGCLWSHMSFFREFMKAMKTAGHEVGMLSDHHPNSQESDISLMNARGFPEPDFWIPCTRDNKGRKILENNIGLHFDDCDQGDPLSIGLLQRQLGSEFYRLMIVEPRRPIEEHHE